MSIVLKNFNMQVRENDTGVFQDVGLLGTSVDGALDACNTRIDNMSWRSNLRFKNLGTSFTATQQAALANGDFTDFWNGDFWIINGVKWRIVDNAGWGRGYGDAFNTWFDTPSLVIMPDQCLTAAAAYVIDSGDSSGNGYANSKYRTTYKSACKTAFQNAFGAAHIAARRELMTSSRGAGGATGLVWGDADVEVPSEENLRGYNAFGTSSAGGSSGFNSSTNGQFKLFQLAPYMLVSKEFIGQGEGNYWTRTIVDANNFSCILEWGLISYAPPSANYCGIRPYAVII